MRWCGRDVKVDGSLILTDGTGINSQAQIIANNGFSPLVISYLDCVGCDVGLKYLEAPIDNTAVGEVINLVTTEPVVSSSDALQESFDTTLADGTLSDGTQEPLPEGELLAEGEPAVSTTLETEQDEDKEAEAELEPPKVLVCR